MSRRKRGKSESEMSRCIFALFTALAFSLDRCVSQTTFCSGNVLFLGDGFCDAETNNLACSFDGGDCCECTCVDSPAWFCGVIGFNCLDPACPGEVPSEFPECVGRFDWLDDGFCDTEFNNVLACGYDGGDCCECTCTDGPVHSCGSNGFPCEDQACLDPAVAVQYPNCTGNWLTIGDGLCTAENNNLPCGYDGGDCCLCTCSGNACTVNEFDCSDPSGGDEIYDCKPPPSTSAPCQDEGQSVWVVENTEQARALAEAVNCSGGSFEVLWRGSVVVDKTIFVFNGTVLNVTGTGSTAIMDGNSSTRLFTVVNASVHVAAVNMSYGAGSVGGAIAAARARLGFDRTSFLGNAAASHGGAIYASDNSVVSFTGDTFFSGNTASRDGGAVYCFGSSCGGEDVTFFNNTAGDDGGAMMVTNYSSSFWTGDAVFNGNRAGGAGGAILTQYGSVLDWSTTATFRHNRATASAGALALQFSCTASWIGKATFDNNSAQQFGGALHVEDASHVWWKATTVFTFNRAGSSGGAMRLTNSSSASWSGSTSYLGNNGLTGGALMIEGRSAAFWSGTTTAVANTAELEGGAVFVSDYSSAVWNGETNFSGNAAGEGGAIHALSNSGLSFAGKTDFCGNHAVDVEREDVLPSGGAFSVYFCTLAFDGETTFTDNQALKAGGAFYMAKTLAVYTGTTSFRNNSADFDGGAIFAFDSTVVLDGNASFRGNSAIGIGGAVGADYMSNISFAGEAEFVSNVAQHGGAIGVLSNSNVEWSGKTTLADNHAFGNLSASGGALYALGAMVSWSGDTTFDSNSAVYSGGGADVNDEATVFWSGDTSFANCAAGFGAALFVVNASDVGWSGNTEFTSNKATFFGGAVGSLFSDEEFNAAMSTLAINGSTTFSNNTAGTTGGGLALNGMLTVTFQAPDVLFVANSAEIVGGAVFVSSFGIGPVFSGVRFVDNFAGAGGAVYITGSGNEDLDAFVLTPTSATTFDGCQFIGNRATATGGALESVAGQDHISNSLFMGNTAGVGGALRLGGKTFLDDCSFVDNRSDEGEGPAVDNVGFVGRITMTSFIGNVFNCQPGEYLELNASADAYDVACNGCETSCQECVFEESAVVPMCTQVMQNAASSGGASTLQTVSIDRGFWRASPNSTVVLACYNSEACLGGVTGVSEYCLEGYEGPYCSICIDGYAASFGFACEKCGGKAGGIVVAVVFVLVLIILLVAAVIATQTMSGEIEGGERGRLERLSRYIPLQSIKIVIVAWQIVTQFTAIANVTYPQVYQRFLDTVTFLNFDLGWLTQLSVGCVVDIDIHGRLLIATIGPIIAMLFLAGTYAVAAKRFRGSADDLGKLRRKHVSLVLLLTFLVYSSVSSILFQMFACEDLEDGNRYLRADYRIRCKSSRHVGFQVYAGFMIVIYTVGIPTFYATLLFRDRHVLKAEEVGRVDSLRIKSFSDLWEPYKPSIFYYELIECARRVLLTGTVVFIYPNTSAQIAVTLMIAFFFAMTSEGLAPYVSKWETWISRMGHVVVYVSMYLALLLKVDVSDEHSSSQKVFEAVLVAVHLGLILAVVVETVVLIGPLRQAVKEAIRARFRRAG